MFATTHHSSQVHEPTNYTGQRHMSDLKSSSAIRADRELRHDRWVAVAVVLLFVAMIAGLLTLAVFGGNGINPNQGYEYWMMP